MGLNTESAQGPQSAAEVRAASPQGLMSRRAYARHRGVDEKAVRKAIDAGKIPLVSGMIDPTIADASWILNRDGGQHSKIADAVAQSVEQSSALHARVIEPQVEMRQPPPSSTPKEPEQPALQIAPLTEARIQDTREATAIKTIKRRVLEGGLIDAEEVDRTWGEMLQVLKDRIRMMADDDDLIEALMKCEEAAAVRALLSRAGMKALAAMSKGLEGMAA